MGGDKIELLAARAAESARRLHAVLLAAQPGMRGSIRIRVTPPYVNAGAAVKEAVRQCNVRAAARLIGFELPERAQ